MKIRHTIAMIFLLSLLSGCTAHLEPSSNEEAKAEASIHLNRDEAKKAQEEYTRLQEERSL